MTGKKAKKTDLIRYNTGSDLMDTMVGGGLGLGYPAGRFINIVGDKSAGKTFFACEIVAAAQDFYGSKLKWVYDDCESGFTFDTKGLYGFEIMPKKLKDRTRSKTVEQLHGNIKKFAECIKDGEYGIYVVDSLDGATSEEMEDIVEKRYKKFQKGEKLDQGSYQMRKAKFLSQEFFPDVAELIEKKNILVIIISQVRDNIDGNMFTAKYVRTGGKAMDFFCHTVLWLAQMTKIKKMDRAIGAVIKIFNEKSKTPRPYRKAMINILFTHGIDNVGTNLDFLYDLRGKDGKLLTKANDIKWQGEEAKVSTLKEFIIEKGFEKEYKKEHKDFKKSLMITWLEENHKQLYEESFGVAMTRDELIEYIESHNLEDELQRRVFEKWEDIETKIKPNRKPKYRKK